MKDKRQKVKVNNPKGQTQFYLKKKKKKNYLFNRCEQCSTQFQAGTAELHNTFIK